MEFKLFDKPDYAAGRPGDAAWYRDRAVSDHISEEGMHRGRLLEVADLIAGIRRSNYSTIADWGAGNGGLLNYLENECRIDCQAWGYDMSPLAVKYAQDVYGVDVKLLDVVSGIRPTIGMKVPLPGNITILTEFLEHIVNPHDLLKELHCHTKELTPALIVASTPCNENPSSFYEYHLWAWTGDSFAQMFERCGWRVLRHYLRADVNTQFVLAERK